MNAVKTPLINLSRDWIRAQGPDALRFLNGMWTCDFKRAADNAASGPTCGQGLLLNPKGKPLGPATFVCEGSQNFLLSVAHGSGSSIFEALNHYIVADDVELELLETPPFAVGIAAQGYQGSTAVIPVPPSVPDAKDKLYRVIRENWGWRVPQAVLTPQHEELWIEHGKWVQDGKTWPFPVQELSVNDLMELRIQAGVPEWLVDFNAESLILEFPFAQAISFHKGCYIGQEVVARGTYRGKMNRGFCRFEASSSLTADWVYSEDDPARPIGKITTCFQNRGLGLLRLSALSEKIYQDQNGSRVFIDRVQSLI